MAQRLPINYNVYTEDELLKMSKVQATKNLNERQQRFCEYYVEGHNRRVAVIKAGYSANGNRAGQYLLHDENVMRYIQWLKARILKEHFLTAYDLIDEWVRIAFSDITDFVEIKPYTIRLKPADEIDGQLVKTIKTGRDGVSIELHDKMKALDNLARYIDDMPKDWKQKIEERKAELLEEEFELKKKQQEYENPQPEDDGFMEAIKESIESIWEED